jgi:hypothetical protein
MPPHDKGAGSEGGADGETNSAEARSGRPGNTRRFNATVVL